MNKDKEAIFKNMFYDPEKIKNFVSGYYIYGNIKSQVSYEVK